MTNRFVGSTTGGPPSIGDFKVGDFVLATTETDEFPDNVFAWVCVESGFPGVWEKRVKE